MAEETIAQGPAVELPLETVNQLIASIENLTAAVQGLKVIVDKRLPAVKVSDDEETHYESSDDEFVGRADISQWITRPIWDQSVIEQEEKDRWAPFLKVFDGLPDAHKQWDPWKCLPLVDWKSRSRASGEPVVPNIIRYYDSNPDERLLVQKRMFLGLSKWWWQHGKPFSAEFSRLRGTLDMEPLVALIGMRLPTYKGPRDPRLVLSVLNELLHLPESDPLADWKKEGVFWNRTATVGSVLDRCYERHILQQPDEDDNMAHSMQQILVVEALRLISIWEGYAFLQKPNEPSRDIRNTRLSKLFSWGQIVGGWIEKFKSTEQTFRSSELSLPTLQRAGNIQITWTQYLDKHLEFDVDSSTLRVFWFGFMIQAAPFFHIWCKKYKPQCGWAGHGPGSWPVGDELLETYSLLFRSPSDIYIANLAEYGKMPIPEWVRVLYGDETGVLSEHAAPTMSYLTRRPRPWLSDMEFHAQSLANRIPVIQRFDSYPIFGDQLRMLKAYMDAQKPGGIVGLWRDNRDSMAWYTFWAVVFVGSLSLVLSFLSLIVSIAQTYSSFQSLYASQSEREL